MADTLGVLGGGQLGRYFVLAAKSLGFRTVVLEPDPQSPAGAVADEHLVAAYDDRLALEHLATTCQAVTVEFENPPATALEFLAQHLTVRPSPSAVAVTQDRRSEKQLCARSGLAVAPWWEVNDARAAARVMESVQEVSALPASAAGARPAPAPTEFILKTARLGYDGKGQHRFSDITRLPAIWAQAGGVACVLESVVPLDAELSMILARGADGSVATYAATRNEHRNGILDTSCAPLTAAFASLKPLDNAEQIIEQARLAATTLATALDYVGVLAVEFFVSQGHLLVNELAPRPHNSGHWTLDSSHTSQFEQQVRTLAGLPLGDTSMTNPSVAMANLLGDRWQHGEPQFHLVLDQANARLHLYGKHEARPARKMGHLTCFTEPSATSGHVNATEASDVLAQVRALRDAMTLSDGSAARP